MFVRNAWYIAAEVPEIHSALVSRTILGERLVIFRTSDGALGALEDRCPHRLAPLSLGKVVGENLRCGYHGAEFARDGHCAKVPGQSAVSGAVAVRSFPVLERHGYVWVWLGDSEGASDQTTIPTEFSASTSPGWLGCYGHVDSLKADYRLINDNLFDITHAEFVHPESFGGNEVHLYRDAHAGTTFVDKGMTYNIEPKSIHFRTYVAKLGSEGAPFWRQMLAHSLGLHSWNEPVDFKMKVSWWAPSYWSFHISVRPFNQPEVRAAEILNLHAAIPEGDFSSHYFYRCLRNYGDESMSKLYADANNFIFGQDRKILEGQQSVVGEKDLFDARPVSFKGDRLQMEARKIISKLASQVNLV
jgi:phenylpropionate dioxygenase-like ring-hydroxylating dioxygenase large terminal subunit